jgi:drug/metabolite transporter (DMT)-like permease
MSFLSIVLGLLSAFCWGTADFLGGLASKRKNIFQVLIIVQFTGLIFLLPLCIFFPEPLPSANEIFYGVLAALTSTTGLFLLYKGLSEGTMTIIAPVSGIISAAVPVIFSAFSLGVPPWHTIAGFVIAAISIGLISSGQLKVSSPDFKTLFIAVFAGICFGTYYIFLHLAGEYSAYFPIIFIRAVSAGLIFIILLFKRPKIKTVSDGNLTWLMIAGGLTDVLANLFYLLGTHIERVDLIAVLGALYPGATIIWSWIILHETISPLQKWGIFLSLLGIVLITL